MPKAIWNDVVIAEADQDQLVEVEGNLYFPLSTVNRQYLQASNTQTNCPWKGIASYYHLVVDGATNRDAVWYYPTPKAAAREISGRVAFWRGVKVA